MQRIINRVFGVGVTIAISLSYVLTIGHLPLGISKELLSSKTKILRFVFPKSSIGTLAIVTSKDLDTGVTSWNDTAAGVGDVSLTVKENENVILSPAPPILMNLKLLSSTNQRQIDGIRVKYLSEDESLDTANLILKQLAVMKDIKYMLMMRMNASDAGMESLGKMDKLVRLDLSNTQVTGSFLSLWKNFPKLQTLELLHCPINPEHLKNLQHFPELKYLDLRNSRLNSTATESISNCPKLERLSLAENRNINNKSLLALQHLPRLQELDLNDTAVTKEGLINLKTFPLTRLTLSNRLMPAKIQLQKILPHCGFIFARNKENVNSEVLTIFAPLK